MPAASRRSNRGCVNRTRRAAWSIQSTATIGRLSLGEELQQLGISGQDDGGFVVQDLLVRFERAEKLVELRVLPVGLPVNPRRLRVPLALQLLRVTICLGEELVALPIGLGANLDRNLLALSAIFLRDAIAL